MRARFAKVPIHVLSDESLLPSAVRIYAALDTFADDRTRLAYPSYEKIALRSASTPATVKRAIAQLERAGHIEVTRRPNRPHVYRLLDGGSPMHPQGVTGATPGGSPMPPELDGSSHTHPLEVPERFAPPGASVTQGKEDAGGGVGRGDHPRPGGKSGPDPVFDALAAIWGADPHKLTRSAGRTVGIAASQIREADPDATSDEIHRRAATYVRLHPTWSLTPMSLAKYWGSLESGYAWRPGGAGDPSARPAPVPPTSTPHAAPKRSSPAAHTPPSPEVTDEVATAGIRASNGDAPPSSPPPVQDSVDPAHTDDEIFLAMKDTLDEILGPTPQDP